MEVPAKFRSALAGFRYCLLAFIFISISAFLVSCGGSSSTVTITDTSTGASLVTTNGNIILTIDETDPLVANGVDTALVRAEVYDIGGTLVPDGTTVNFSLAPTGKGTVPASATTIDGIAAVKVKAGTVAGGYNITATAGDVSQIAYGQIVPGPAALLTNAQTPLPATTLTANPNSIQLNGETSLLTLVAKDQYGNLVADGTPVTFIVTSDDLRLPGTLAPTSTNTSGGVATTVLTSPNDTETSTVTVTAVVGEFNDVTTTAKVGFGEAVIIVIEGGGSGTAVEVELTAATNSISVKGSSGIETTTIRAIAVDETGERIPTCIDDTDPNNPITLNNIRFDILYGPNGGENLEGFASIEKATTNGEAVVSLSSGTVSGTVTIQASVILNGLCTIAPFTAPLGPGDYFARGLLTGFAIESGEPANIIIFSDNLLTPNDDGSISQTFSALIQDQHGNPVVNGTGVFFGLVDNPNSSTPPYLGYLSGGFDGVTAGTKTFASASTDFPGDGVMDEDILIILEGRNEGGHRIDTVNTPIATGQITLYNTMIGTETALDFVAGFAELGTVCGSVQTGNLEMNSSCIPTAIGTSGSIKGVAHTTLTWTPQGIFKPFHLYAESVGGDVGDTLADTYPAVTPVDVALTLAPSNVRAGDEYISAVAEINDGKDNAIQGEFMNFSSSNTGVASFIDDNDTANPADDIKNLTSWQDATSTQGIASAIIGTATCLAENTNVTITAQLGGIYLDTATLTVTATEPTADFSFANVTTDFILTNTSTEPPGFTYSYSWTFGGCTGYGTAPGSQENPTIDCSGVSGTNQIIQLAVTNVGQGCTHSVSKIIAVP